ncbi:methionine--tRNA ligase [Candidatus Gottesmanbacteria bacterium]|nr:methionine--tRNA ligase [Candidatus Gottesmanbacteria bacterium]
MNKFFITTASDYTNDVVHIGHAYQKILADALARYHRLIGDKTNFLTGTDENGQKVAKSAAEQGLETKDFVDKIAAADQKQWQCLNISYDRFFRSTDEDHVKFAREIYLKCKAAGDIYLSKYEGLYCEGCEAYYDESELTDGKCPFHLNKKIQKLSEDNYFFRLSKYQNFLIDHFGKHPEFVWPESKRNEVLAFIKRGLRDFSVSRQSLTWGITVPDDPKQKIYVWFDALLYYLTYGVEEKCWPADVQILGKDNSKFHAIYWPAMLKSAGYELPKTILVHDFITLNGQKISKSLGNVIRPTELVKKFGADGVRYYFLRFGPLTNDVDISIDKITETYNADLANGLGNLVARIAKLAEKVNYESRIKNYELWPEVKNYLNNFRVDSALEFVWIKIKKLDRLIDQNKPWELGDKKLAKFLDKIIPEIQNLAFNLQPFLPATAEKIQKQFTGKIKSGEPLFPRI